MNRPDWRALRRIGGPTKQDLLQSLRDYRDDLKGYDPADLTDPGCDETSGDVRLQVHDGFWSLRTGDAQYDHDHRGFWGAGSVSPNENLQSLTMTAEDLASQVLDMAAEDHGHE